MNIIKIIFSPFIKIINYYVDVFMFRGSLWEDDTPMGFKIIMYFGITGITIAALMIWLEYFATLLAGEL